jgi:hypothetical protein
VARVQQLLATGFGDRAIDTSATQTSAEDIVA